MSDQLCDITPSLDGGFLLEGTTPSLKGGDITEERIGKNDYWLVRIDKDGNKIWDKRFGGLESEILKSVSTTSQGDFIIGGYSYSGAGFSKTESHRGKGDY